MVDAVECTAAEHARNPLMTPPCDCPRCAPPRVPAGSAGNGAGTIWIAVDGHPVRYDVHDMCLGERGHRVLG